MNIAEGYGKKAYPADYRRFLYIALGSNDEVTVQLDYAKDLGYISNTQHEQLTAIHNQIGRMLRGLINSIAGI